MISYSFRFYQLVVIYFTEYLLKAKTFLISLISWFVFPVFGVLQVMRVPLKRIYAPITAG